VIYDPVALAPAISFHRLRDDAIWLEQLLDKSGIPLRADTELAEAINLAKSLPELASSPPGFFNPRNLAAPLGLLYLSRALQDAQHNQSFKNVCRLLPKLASNSAVPAAQDSKQSNERDLVFELEIAAIMASMGAIVTTANEPDVSFSYDGSTWDGSCKLIYSKKPVTLNDRIEEGIAQLLRAPADYSLVFVGITNRVNHRKFMPLIESEGGAQFWGVFKNGTGAVKAMHQTLRETTESIVRERDIRFLRARDSAKFRGIVTILHAVVGLGSIATLLSATGFIPRAELFGEVVAGPEEILVKRLNDRMQEIFTG
jgi:hypothetical protein